MSGRLWGAAEVTGELISVDPADPRPVEHPAGTLNEPRFTGPLYWNPHTRTVGRFGGYGEFRNSGQRWEWDAAAGRWREVIPVGEQPWPRTGPVLVPGARPGTLWLFGGQGNRSGVQGEFAPRLPHDDNFSLLDDLWQLDLATGRWTCRLPVQDRRWGNPGQLAALAGGRHLLMLRRTASGTENPPRFWLCPTDAAAGLPAEIPATGETAALHSVWSFLPEPDRESALLFGRHGVWRLTLVRR